MSSHLPVGVTDREIEKESLMDDDTVSCTHCEREMSYFDQGIVEVSTTTGTHYFCDNACRAKTIYDETYTAKGRASLKRFVAALHLIMDEDVTVYAPALTIYDADDVLSNPRFSKRDHIDIAKFREHAMAFMNLLSPDDSVGWAFDAQGVAAEFAEQVGKTESSKPVASAKGSKAVSDAA